MQLAWSAVSDFWKRCSEVDRVVPNTMGQSAAPPPIVTHRSSRRDRSTSEHRSPNSPLGECASLILKVAFCPSVLYPRPSVPKFNCMVPAERSGGGKVSGAQSKYPVATRATTLRESLVKRRGSSTALHSAQNDTRGESLFLNSLLTAYCSSTGRMSLARI